MVNNIMRSYSFQILSNIILEIQLTKITLHIKNVLLL